MCPIFYLYGSDKYKWQWLSYTCIILSAFHKVSWPEKRSYWKAKITRKNRKQVTASDKVRSMHPLSPGAGRLKGSSVVLDFAPAFGEALPNWVRPESSWRCAEAPSPSQCWLCYWAQCLRGKEGNILSLMEAPSKVASLHNPQLPLA